MTNQTLLLQGVAQKLGMTTELKDHKSRKTWIKDYVNGVAFEVEHRVRDGWTLIASWNSSEVTEEIKVEFEDWAPYTKCNGGAWFDNLKDEKELFGLAFRVKQFILDSGFHVKNRRSKPKTSDEGYFEKTAQVIKLAVEIEHWDILERGGLGFDAHDDLITVGQSQAALANPESPTWREHLVPCTMIKDRAIEMVQQGASLPQIAQMLKENLAIVTITQDEQKVVDALYQTTMPAGWTWGDSVFARLDAVGIAY